MTGVQTCALPISDRSFLFKTSNDLMTLVLSYLDVQSICHIDIAVSNAAERHIWWTSLSVNHHVTFSKHEHCKESIRWLVKRDIRLERLKTKDMKWESDRINWSTLLGLNMSSLQYINVQRCSIGDEEVLLIAHGCPHLSEIDIFDCKNITDVGISYLAASCSEMSRINLDNCSLITDIGISNLALSCPLLSRVNLSYCWLITDVGISAIGSSCPLVSIIILSRCNEITDIEIGRAHV